MRRLLAVATTIFLILLTFPLVAWGWHAYTACENGQVVVYEPGEPWGVGWRMNAQLDAQEAVWVAWGESVVLGEGAEVWVFWDNLSTDDIEQREPRHYEVGECSITTTTTSSLTTPSSTTIPTTSTTTTVDTTTTSTGLTSSTAKPTTTIAPTTTETESTTTIHSSTTMPSSTTTIPATTTTINATTTEGHGTTTTSDQPTTTTTPTSSSTTGPTETTSSDPPKELPLTGGQSRLPALLAVTLLTGGLALVLSRWARPSSRDLRD